MLFEPRDHSTRRVDLRCHIHQAGRMVHPLLAVLKWNEMCHRKLLRDTCLSSIVMATWSGIPAHVCWLDIPPAASLKLDTTLNGQEWRLLLGMARPACFKGTKAVKAPWLAVLTCSQTLPARRTLQLAQLCTFMPGISLQRFSMNQVISQDCTLRTHTVGACMCCNNESDWWLVCRLVESKGLILLALLSVLLLSSLFECDAVTTVQKE
jgi:hypothetical protein